MAFYGFVFIWIVAQRVFPNHDDDRFIINLNNRSILKFRSTDEVLFDLDSFF